MQCTYHPKTETALRCSKCDRAICGKCAVQTPVGGRCKECAKVRGIPTYTLGTVGVMKGLGATIVVGIAAGAAFGLISARGLVPPAISWLYTPLALVASGYLVGEAVSLATNRKRAPASRALVVGGFILAYAAFELLAPGFQIRGLYSILGLVGGVLIALGRVR